MFLVIFSVWDQGLSIICICLTLLSWSICETACQNTRAFRGRREERAERREQRGERREERRERREERGNRGERRKREFGVHIKSSQSVSQPASPHIHQPITLSGHGGGEQEGKYIYIYIYEYIYIYTCVACNAQRAMWHTAWWAPCRTAVRLGNRHIAGAPRCEHTVLAWLQTALQYWMHSSGALIWTELMAFELIYCTLK